MRSHGLSFNTSYGSMPDNVTTSSPVFSLIADDITASSPVLLISGDRSLYVVLTYAELTQYTGPGAESFIDLIPIETNFSPNLSLSIG